MTSSTSPRLLIVTSCTGEKQHHPEQALTHQDFLQGAKHLHTRERELDPFMLPAGEMYTGMQHQQVQQALKNFHAAGLSAEAVIISAGYGLLSWEQKVAPYNVTFSEMTSKQLDSWAHTLNIRSRLEETMQDYDVVFFLLGEAYLRSTGLPQKALKTRKDQSLCFLLSPSLHKKFPRHAARQSLFLVGVQQARDYHCGLVGLKGKLLNILSQHALQTPGCLEEWREDPTSINAALEAYVQEVQA